MIAARVLLRSDLNPPVKLDCSACAESAELRASLGCGRPPLIPVDVNGQVETVEWSREWYDKTRKITLEEDSDETARTYWGLADFGGLSELIGLWDCCPMYFDRFADLSSSMLANHAIDLSWWLESGSLESVARLPLGLEESQLLQFAVACQRLIKVREMEARNGTEGRG